MGPVGSGKLNVLNAFRHHRGGHAALPRRPAPPAWVLNAFRHHRGGHSKSRLRVGTMVLCAQRLSASQRWASRQRGGQSTCAPVLNAFRHHRGGHQQPARPRLKFDSAQRLSASQRWASGDLPLTRQGRACSTPFGITEVGIAVARAFQPGCQAECSTPFGITEVGIRLTRRESRAAKYVLNAFRHHRGGHLITRLASSAFAECSTPFGITEVGI